MGVSPRGEGTRVEAAAPRWTTLLAACLAVLALDQATKAVVRSTLALGQQAQVAGLFSVEHLQNPGIAGGSFAGRAVPLALLATVAVVGILAFLARNGVTPLILVGFGLLIGGGFGNLMDRLRLGYVTDFILNGDRAFNFADVAIFAGTTVILLGLILLLLIPRRESSST
jgi:signal peptidase II